jgi:hypothetical protein
VRDVWRVELSAAKAGKALLMVRRTQFGCIRSLYRSHSSRSESMTAYSEGLIVGFSRGEMRGMCMRLSRALSKGCGAVKRRVTPGFLQERWMIWERLY